MKYLSTLFVVVVIMTAVLADPQPPMLPNQFTAEVVGKTMGISDIMMLYADYDLGLGAMIAEKSITFVGKIKLYCAFADSTDCVLWRHEWSTSCKENNEIPPIPPRDVLQGAKFLGEKTINNVACYGWETVMNEPQGKFDVKVYTDKATDAMVTLDIKGAHSLSATFKSWVPECDSSCRSNIIRPSECPAAQ